MKTHVLKVVKIITVALFILIMPIMSYADQVYDRQVSTVMYDSILNQILCKDENGQYWAYYCPDSQCIAGKNILSILLTAKNTASRVNIYSESVAQFSALIHAVEIK